MHDMQRDQFLLVKNKNMLIDELSPNKCPLNFLNYACLKSEH